MNAALLADTAWLDDELSSFQHLVVGLIDERVRVIQVVPEEVPGELSSVFAERIGWSESRWKELNRWRLAKLDQSLERADAHLIHAMHARLWRGAVRLGEEMNVPVILGSNAAPDLDEVEKLVRANDPARLAFAASTEPIVRALRPRLDPAVVVEFIPPGVHVAEESVGCADHESLCVIVSGNGVLDAHYQTLLQSLTAICREHPNMQFFFDGQGSDQHQIWKAASKLDLLHNVSMIPRRLGHRELLLRADVLLHPQPLGQARSITLQAMAHGLTVVAHEDPWLDYLIDDQTAWVVRDAGVDTWSDSINRVIADQAVAEALGARARQWVKENRTVSDQIERTLKLYRGLTGETLPFPG